MGILLFLMVWSSSPPVFAGEPVRSIAAAPAAVQQWEDNMVQYGRRHCGGDYDYDGARVFYQIAEYTHDPSWIACAERAAVIYRDHYLVPNTYRAAGWKIFPRGLWLHFQKTGDAKSKDAVIQLAGHAAYCCAPQRLTQADGEHGGSREAAYNLEAKLYAEDLGVDQPTTKALADIVFGHFDQWFRSKSAPYVRPFMVALSAEALIEYWERTKERRVLPVLQEALEQLWQSCWLADARAFKYTDRNVPSGDQRPSPDLNLLIAPAYAWVYAQTHDPTWRVRHDAIFAGAVSTGSLQDPKHFHQQYRWSFDGLKWRQ